jgi:hypothetical protein
MKRLSMVIGILSAVVFACSAQTGIGRASALAVIDYRVPEFVITTSTFGEGISALSLSTNSELHLGFEEVLQDATSPSPPRFSLSLKNSTIRQILDALCAHDTRYTWRQDGATLNIFPKEISGSDSYLLNRKLERITVTTISSPEAALAFLDRQLPPPREQLAYAGAGGDSHYSAPWTQSYDDITVRQFINRVSEHMASHTSWVFYGSKQERLFTFRKGGFH